MECHKQSGAQARSMEVCALNADLSIETRPCRADPQSASIHLVIAGYYGFGNLGDEAVLTSMLSDLESAVPGARVTVVSNDPAETSERYGVGAVRWQNLQEVMKALESADLLLLGGGGLFNCYLEYDSQLLLTQDHSLFSVFTFGLPMLAHLMGKPCMIYAVGASRFTSEEAAQDARMAVDVATVCTVRDGASREILRSFGADAGRIAVTADPAFRLTNASADRVTEILRAEGIAPRGPLIVASIRNWPFHGDQERTEEAVRHALARMIDTYDATVLFVPFDTNTALGELSDDRTAIGRLTSKLDRPHHVRTLKARYTPSEISGIIGHSTLLLGMRLHSLILAVRNAVPCVGLVYDPKVRSIMEMAGAAHFLLDLPAITGERAFELLASVYRNRKSVAASLRAPAKALSQRALRNAHLAAACLAGGKPKQAVLSNETLQDLHRHVCRLAFHQTRRVLAFQLQERACSDLIRTLLDEGQYSEGLRVLDAVLEGTPAHPEWNYLKAFSLQSIQGDPKAALRHYENALDHGFSRFWVFYNRGSLLLSLGHVEQAIADLEMAVQIDSEHVGAGRVLELAKARLACR